MQILSMAVNGAMNDQCGRYMVKTSFFLILCASFVILSCSKTNKADRIGPTSPVIIPQTADISSVERGIDAVPEGDWIQVEWTHLEKESIRSYQVYRDNPPDSLFRFIAETTDSVFIDKVDTIGARYSYFVKAVNHDGIPSNPSDTVRYRLIAKPVACSPANANVNVKPRFNWHDPNEPPEANYIVRVVQQPSWKTIWITEVTSNYEYLQTVVYNQDGLARDSLLVSGKDYLWRVDIRGTENNSGSESPWMTLHAE
jgi:hypothetical protein